MTRFGKGAGIEEDQFLPISRMAVDDLNATACAGAMYAVRSIDSHSDHWNPKEVSSHNVPRFMVGHWP